MMNRIETSATSTSPAERTYFVQRYTIQKTTSYTKDQQVDLDQLNQPRSRYMRPTPKACRSIYHEQNGEKYASQPKRPVVRLARRSYKIDSNIKCVPARMRSK
jgi:hypothetical protein